MNGLIDFTDAYVKRVSNVRLRFDVQGKTAAECGEKASRVAHTFFAGDAGWQFLSFDVVPCMTLTDGASETHEMFRADVEVGLA